MTPTSNNPLKWSETEIALGLKAPIDLFKSSTYWKVRFMVKSVTKKQRKIHGLIPIILIQSSWNHLIIHYATN